MKFDLPFTLAMVCSVCGLAAAHAACPTWPTATRFQISADGSQVTDKRTGLIWARCSVGQTWDGGTSTCTGTASTMNHETALSTAQGQTGWRLPSVTELRSLADRGCQGPAIDAAVFPNTQSDWHWTSTPFTANTHYAFVVDFNDGGVGNGLSSGLPGINRSTRYAVRLVRDSP